MVQIAADLTRREGEAVNPRPLDYVAQNAPRLHVHAVHSRTEQDIAGHGARSAQREDQHVVAVERAKRPAATAVTDLRTRRWQGGKAAGAFGPGRDNCQYHHRQHVAGLIKMDTTDFHDSTPVQAGSREAIERDRGARLLRKAASHPGGRRTLCKPVSRLALSSQEVVAECVKKLTDRRLDLSLIY